MSNIKEKGIEIIAYHGTENNFEKFDESYIGTSSGNLGFFGKGFYFTKDKNIASCYGTIKTVKLKLSKPFFIQGKISEETAEMLNQITDTLAFYEGLTEREVYNGLASLIPEYPEVAEHIAWTLDTLGYDSVVFSDYKEIVCFNSDDIEIIK